MKPYRGSSWHRNPDLATLLPGRHDVGGLGHLDLTVLCGGVVCALLGRLLPALLLGTLAHLLQLVVDPVHLPAMTGWNEWNTISAPTRVYLRLTSARWRWTCHMFSSRMGSTFAPASGHTAQLEIGTPWFLTRSCRRAYWFLHSAWGRLCYIRVSSVTFRLLCLATIFTSFLAK